MQRTCRQVLASLLLLLTAAPLPAKAQGGPPPEVREAIRAIEAMLESTGDAALTSFAATRLAPSFRRTMSDEAMLAHLRSLRSAVDGPVRNLSVERTPDGMTLKISAAREVSINFALDEEARITVLGLGKEDGPPGGGAGSNAAAEWADLSWDNLVERFRAWESRGFKGVLLAQRGGRELVRAAYGDADATTGRPTALTTIFDIGSTPIDFTMTGILLLAQRGKLALSDPVSRHLPGVPTTMATMTLDHLMTGRSGLPDFHDLPREDWDPDLAWIDRPTALRRIFSQPLLFPPGTGNAHSHSAFGVLAAVIEVVSGTTYRDFVRTEILTPLGMSRTGFYGDRGAFIEADFAVGDGPNQVGLPNIPPNWGPTSWLVMGSGGMFSTLDDMARFYADQSSGGILSGEWAARRQGPTFGVGGSDRGFFMFHVSDGKGNQALGLTNYPGQAPQTRAMVDALRRLILPR